MEKTFTAREAYIIYSVLSRIENASETQEFEARLATCRLIGALRYRIFGDACDATREESEK